MNDTNTQLDMGMIFVLTDGVGTVLGRRVRSSYYELKSRLPKDPAFKLLDVSTQQQIVDILAISLFYTEIISPLESGRSLLSLAHTAKATHVRMGRDKLTSQTIRKFTGCVMAFHELLAFHKIPVEVLSFDTLKSFIRNVQAVQEKVGHATVD